jgi:protein-S-isoprenylcysteine O-methyltransferase Ste14
LKQKSDIEQVGVPQIQRYKMDSYDFTMIDKFFLSSPIFRGMTEKMIILLTGVCGLIFSWKRFPVFPFSHMIGYILILSSSTFHYWAHKRHSQAHEKTSKIKTIVNEGLFSRLRHPLYISVIVLNLGIAFAFGVMITSVFCCLTIVHWVLTALKEEDALMKRFPVEYPKYKQQVRWRMIPWIF